MVARVTVGGDGELLNVVDALGAASSFASLLDRWQKHGDKNADDCDRDQHFDEGEPTEGRESYASFAANSKSRVCGTTIMVGRNCHTATNAPPSVGT